MTAPRPLLHVVQVEQRLTKPTPRDLNERPFMLGEGPVYWTAERIAALAADNEKRRQGKRK